RAVAALWAGAARRAGWPRVVRWAGWPHVPRQAAWLQVPRWAGWLVARWAGWLQGVARARAALQAGPRRPVPPPGPARPCGAVAGRPGEQAPIQAEPEQVVRWLGHGHAHVAPFGHEDLGERLPQAGVGFRRSPSGAVERVLVVLAGKRVQRITPVPVQVGLLG